jgi:hypothetical protein
MRSCQFCGAPMTLGDPIGREATCESCGRDLRCCRQCRHYDPAYHNSCRETEADIVEDKERRNFCEYFSFTDAAFRPAVGRDRQTEARAKLDSLFAKPGQKTKPPDRAAEARSKLDALFRKPDPDD